MVWNYHDDDQPAPSAPVRLAVSGLPEAAGRVLVEHFRIDEGHSNAYTLWQQMGSPQQPTAEQYEKLEAAGQLQLLGSPEWLPVKDGNLELSFLLPRQAVSLLKVSW
jgi:xylan 1,4-beta-xylosidase